VKEENMRWSVRAFEALTVGELYGVLQLRQEVFVVEQRCAYLDADGLDDAALHVFAVTDERVVACARLFAPDVRQPGAAVIGRVVTAPLLRRTGLGRALMARAIAEIETRWGTVPIWLGAQKYLERFYGSFGFVRDGEDYLEDDIPHLPMRRS
jgi:ElaA protein